MRFSALLSLPARTSSFVLTGGTLSTTANPSLQPGLKLRGSVHGGQQAISGARVYLLAANTTGYGQPSLSLLDAASTGSGDSIGGYVSTASDGSFTITGDYTCTANQQVYLYALGGDPGAGNNSASGLLAVLGACPASGNFLTALPSIQVNEVTTIAAAYALSGYATDPTHVSSSGTPLAQTDVANAFLNAANLASVVTGQALTINPAGNATVPQAEINTLANILASCVNSTGPATPPAVANCDTLFLNAMSGTTSPTDTAAAAINIAHNPTANVANLYALPAAADPFSPALPAQPYFSR